MDRELLLEIGCEELPASWLPALTHQIGEVAGRAAARAPAAAGGAGRNLQHAAASDRPHRARVAERQTDLEELVNGPPVSASFKADGTPTPAAAGFAAKQGVEVVGARARRRRRRACTSRSARRQRGKAAVDVLPDVLGGTLRALTFPKLMHWDAMLDDGRGELLFGRPIRWMLFLYGGRVVPFTIRAHAGGADRPGPGRRRRAPSPTAIGS